MVIFMMIVMITSVLAQGTGNGVQEKVTQKTQLKEQVNEAIQNSGEGKKLSGDAKGLENAMLHVTNEYARMNLERNLERFQEKNQYKYAEMNSYETEDGKQLLRAERQQQFFIFKFNIVDEYELDSEGELLSENRGFISKIFPRKTI